MKPSNLAFVLLAAGTFFSLFIALHQREGSSEIPWILLTFIVGPWIAIDVLYIWLRWEKATAITSGLMLTLEILIYYTVFKNPQSSTDPLVYAIKPLLQLFICVPIGFLIGKILDKKNIAPNSSIK